jgi:hypothetical protein
MEKRLMAPFVDDLDGNLSHLLHFVASLLGAVPQFQRGEMCYTEGGKPI